MRRRPRAADADEGDGGAAASSQLEKGQAKPSAPAAAAEGGGSGGAGGGADGGAGALIDDVSAPKVIDHFALWELRMLLRLGLHRAIWWVRGLLTTYLLAGCALAAVTTWLLLGSDVDEVLACFLLIATSLSFTLALLQLLRAVAAPKLVAVGPERIRAHMATIFF